MSDFDDIFGDLKEDQQIHPTLTSSDLDEASIFGDLSSSTRKIANTITEPLDKPSGVEPPPAPSAQQSWESIGSREQDDFLSWLDDGGSSTTATATSAPLVANGNDSLSSAMGDIDLDDSPISTSTSLSPPIPVHVQDHMSDSMGNTNISLDDDDDDDLEKIVQNANRKAQESLGSRENSNLALHAKSQRPAQAEHHIDVIAVRKAFIETGVIPAGSRLALWKNAIQMEKKESISMYALQTTPLDLPNQALLRKEVESLCAIIFSSAVHQESVQAEGDSIDGTQLVFIDSTEILITYLCKHLRVDYTSGFALTFAPLIAAGGNDPLNLDLVELLRAVCHHVLPHLSKQIGTKTISTARRPLLKWLLLYHAPSIAFHLDQHLHTWNEGSDEMNSVIPDSWIVSMFESESTTCNHLDSLMKIWDCCLLMNAPKTAETAFPSTAMCYVIVHLIARAEKKLMRMEGEQLRHCMAQTLVEFLQDRNDKLIQSVQKIVDATPPSFCLKLGDAGHVQLPVPVVQPPTNVTESKSTASAPAKFSLLSASTNGVKELSSMMIDMPTKLLTSMVPLNLTSTSSSGSSGSPDDELAAAKQLLYKHIQVSAISSISMTLPAAEVIPHVFRSFQSPAESKQIRYFIIDCRAMTELKEGQIPTAFHFDPDAVTDPQVLDQVMATLNPMKATVHLCVMGQGYGHIATDLRRQEDIQQPVIPSSPFTLNEDFFEAYTSDLSRVNAAVLFLAKRGFPHVSVLAGGYVAAHEQLFHSSETFTVADLIDHDAPNCSMCAHQRSMMIVKEADNHVALPKTISSTNTGSEVVQTNDALSPTGQSSRESSATTMTLPQPKTSTGGGAALDAKALFDSHAHSSTKYFSSFTGALKTSGKTLLSPADSLKDGKKWLMKKSASDSGESTDNTKASGAISSPSSSSSMLSGGLANFTKIRSSIAQMGSESLDMLKKAEQATVGKGRMAFGSATSSPVTSPTTKPPLNSTTTTPAPTTASRNGGDKASGSCNSTDRNASFRKSEDEVFTIDDDEDEEQDDFVGGGSSNSRTTSSSSIRNESFTNRGADGGGQHGMPTSVVLHHVEKGHVKELKKGMHVSRVQILPCVESPFFSGYKKKKIITQAPAGQQPPPPAKTCMLPRRIVIMENHIVVLKAERNMDDIYLVKSIHYLSHLARMTCLKKNALMVTVYYKWKAADGQIHEKRNSYEVQQRDEFIKAIKTAMEKIHSDQPKLSRSIKTQVREQFNNYELHGKEHEHLRVYSSAAVLLLHPKHQNSIFNMADKKRDSLTSNIDEVARNQIWREQLRTEYKMESALTPFQLNPKTLSSITLKPTMTNPVDFGKIQDNSSIQELDIKMKELTKKPNEKHSIPMTEAQRVGWLHEMAAKGIRADMQQRMFKGRGSCDVTKFADTYCTMAGCSPFADKSTR